MINVELNKFERFVSQVDLIHLLMWLYLKSLNVHRCTASICKGLFTLTRILAY